MTPETKVRMPPRRRRVFFLFGLPALALTSAYAMTDTVFTDLIVYRTCVVSLNINDTDCSILRDDARSPKAMDLEARVESYASTIVMTNSLIRTILPAILSLFFGSRSDQAGRKPLLLATFSGTIFMFIALSLMSNWNISPWYLLLPSMLANIVGGFFTAKLALVCLISDTAEDNDKISQMTLLEASFIIGALMGEIPGSFIYKNYGYTHIFAAAAGCHIFGLVHTYFFITETVKKTTKESKRELFKIAFIKELLASCFVKREGFHRMVIWVSILALTLSSVVSRGDATINFLFTRTRLAWDVQPYFYYRSSESVIRLVGMCGVSLRRRFPETSDTLFALVSFASALGCALVKSIAWKSWHMYLAAFLGIFTGLAMPVLRSIISKFTPAQDAGKVFSVGSFFETLGAFGGPALHTIIYSYYLPPIYPSPVYLLSVSLYIILLICTLVIELLIRTQRKPSSYMPAAQEEDPR